MWCWGAWRIKALKKYVDQLIVLYPFEVDWYKQRGLNAQWLGSPVLEALEPYRKRSILKSAHPEDPFVALAKDGRLEGTLIALIPGSRISEIERLLPLFLQAAIHIKKSYPEVRFVLPLARSLSKVMLEEFVFKHDLSKIWQSVDIVSSEEEKFSILPQCLLAMSKPGTVTLELALLQVPTLVVYKTSWLTYNVARQLVSVSSMTLPNLLLGKQVFKELIQNNCDPETIAHEVLSLYESTRLQDEHYQRMMADCKKVTEMLGGRNRTMNT